MILRKAALFPMFLFAATLFGQPGPTADFPGYKDPALFTRMPNYYLHRKDSFVERTFDGYDFPVELPGKPFKRERVEGHFLIYTYQYNEAAGPVPSPLQIIRNYQAAAARIGGVAMTPNWNDGRGTTIKIGRNGQDTWAFLQPFYQGRQYRLTIVERQTMQQDVVANASALQDGLTQNGHVEVAGIFFDTARAEIKPESEAALQQIAKMLQGNPALRVWVVGHTDNVGSAESNATLSNARAASVVAYLSQKAGVDPRRLAPRGVGPFAPVASNATEEGRARNRRVELVAQ